MALSARSPKVILPVVLAVVLASIAGYTTSPPNLRTAATVISGLAAFLIALSILLFIWLRRRLALLTAVAALSLLWAALSALTAAISSTCPGVAGDAARCTPQEILAQAGVGLLLPVIPAILILPARSIFRTTRLMIKRVRTMSATPAQKATVASKESSKAATGRTTPKGTRPQAKSPKK
jgi:hypothetical protein